MKCFTFRGWYCDSSRVIFIPTPLKIKQLTADPFAPVDPRFPGRPGAPCWQKRETWRMSRREATVWWHSRSHCHAFSSPEAALLLVSTKNRDLWPGPTPEVRDSRTSRHSLHAQSQVWQIWLVLVSNLLCLQSHSKPECRWTGPEVAILGADQKEHGLWGWEWLPWWFASGFYQRI